MLQHKFEITNKDGTKETRTSTLCEFGAPTGSGGYSAMAKLVGVPCGVGKSPRFPFLFDTARIQKTKVHCRLIAHPTAQP